MSEPNPQSGAQTPPKLSSRSNYSPEAELPLGIANHMWAKAVWHKKHPKGPSCIVFHLHPLRVFVAGWTPWAGSRCLPKLVDCIVDPEPWEADTAIAELGFAVFAGGPTVSMIEEAARITAAYSNNAKKGGRPRKLPTVKSPAPGKPIRRGAAKKRS